MRNINIQTVLVSKALADLALGTPIDWTRHCGDMRAKFVKSLDSLFHGDGMKVTAGLEAWNNFVLNSHECDYPEGSCMRLAALAKRYMNSANSGGINSFLTISYDIDASEVLNALVSIGASEAAVQLGMILRALRTPLRVSHQEDRWELLEQNWTDDLNDHDALSDDSDRSLMQALEKHVLANKAFYIALE